MMTMRHARASVFVGATFLAALGCASSAFAQEGPPAPPGNGSPAGAVSSPNNKTQGAGVAVLALAGAKSEAFALARAIYASKVRPPNLDEVRARVLAGADPPANASRELRELAEVRAGVNASFDAPSRRLLAGIAQQVGAQALLVVKVEKVSPPSTDADAGAPGDSDAGAAAAAPPADADGGAPSGPTAPSSTVVARLLLVEGAELDAAQYAPDPDGSWKGTVASLERRFPVAARTVAGPPAATSVPTPLAEEKSKPFYTSGWFWGAVGAAALLGGAFFLASRDSSSDSIHLEMRVPK